MLVVRADLGIGIHAPYDTGRSGYYNMTSFKNSLAFHLAIEGILSDRKHGQYSTWLALMSWPRNIVAAAENLSGCSLVRNWVVALRVSLDSISGWRSRYPSRLDATISPWVSILADLGTFSRILSSSRGVVGACQYYGVYIRIGTEQCACLLPYKVVCPGARCFPFSTSGTTWGMRVCWL